MTRLTTWSSPADLKGQVQKLWDRGVLLASQLDGEVLFPRRLTLKKPSSRELSDRFAEVRSWIVSLEAAAEHYRIERRDINHRVLGANTVPEAIWVDTMDDALALIGKHTETQRFVSLVAQTRATQPELLYWLKKRPLHALSLADHWPQLMDFVGWLKEHPRPHIYLRQIALPRIHTKLLESLRGELAELLDLVLPHEAVDKTYTGIGGFCRRYGFLDKPVRVRLRMLDSRIRLLPEGVEQDVSLTQTAFAALRVPVSKVFITENEVNFLAFPKIPEAMVIFGAGYGFDNLANAAWLQGKAIWYWGDIDTHGFAILSQLRQHVPHATSLLMDEQTLLAHRSLWGTEARPETRDLTHLTAEEAILYDQLCRNHWGKQLRLEQEKIGFDLLFAVLQRL